ncbi:hypothetical protein QE390_001173 [Siphonobacter sp. SORGH_AS 1065]|nr:hypothetical protein [Siphonobacter sp. SORGH_AS_1065]
MQDRHLHSANDLNRHIFMNALLTIPVRDLPMPDSQPF